MQLSDSLTHLESSDLVRRLREEDLAYLIKHALVQDTAQESLLKNDRKRLHRLVAEALENLYAEHLDEIAARLLQHYDAAGNEAKALEYAERAGDAAMRVSAYAEAIAAYQRALDLARARADATTTYIRLMTALGRAYELAPNYDAAFALYEQTRAEARTRADRTLELAALVQMSKVLAVASMRYDPTHSMEIAEQALEIARALNDQYSQARVLWIMLLMNLYGGAGVRQAVVYGEQALALARALDWREQMAYTLNDLFYAYLNLGQMQKADECSAAAQGLWRELDNKPMLTDNLISTGMGQLVRGEYQKAMESTYEGRALSKTIGNPWGETTSYMLEGYIQHVRGEWNAALDSFQNCMRVGDPIGVFGPIVMARFESAQIFAFLGAHERAEQFARDGLERTRRQAVNWTGWAYAVLAVVAFARGERERFEQAVQDIGDEPSEYFYDRIMPMGAVIISIVRARAAQSQSQGQAARELLEFALARIRQSNYHIFEVPVLNELARLELAQQQFTSAQETLRCASELAQTLNLRVARLEIAVTQLELAQAQRAADVAAARTHAQKMLNEFLPYVPNELRDSFLRTPLIQRVNDA